MINVTWNVCVSNRDNKDKTGLCKIIVIPCPSPKAFSPTVFSNVRCDCVEAVLKLIFELIEKYTVVSDQPEGAAM